MEWIGSVRGEKFNSKSVGTKVGPNRPPGPFFAPVLHRTGIGRKPTGMNLGSNIVDWVRPWQKIQQEVGWRKRECLNDMYLVRDVALNS